MRGFSVFAPLLGAVMLATAIAFAVTVTAYEVQRSAQIRDLAAEIHVKTLPDVFKWDALSTFAVALRNWFYNYYVYTDKYTPKVKMAKEDFVNALLAFLSVNPSDKDTLWSQIGTMKYRYYVEAKENELEKLYEVTETKPETKNGQSLFKISVDPKSADLSNLPKFTVDVDTGVRQSTYSFPLFGLEGFSIPIYYPLEDMKKAVEDLRSYANNFIYVAGFIGKVGSGRGDPSAAMYKRSWEKVYDLKERSENGWINDTERALKPCKNTYTYWDYYIDDQKVLSHWEARISTLDPLRDFLNDKDYEWELVQVEDWKKVTVDEKIPYIRLICFTGPAAYAFAGDETALVCRRVTGDSDICEGENQKCEFELPYIQIKQIKLRIKKEFKVGCGTVKTEQDLEAAVTLEFKKDAPTINTATWDSGIKKEPTYQPQVRNGSCAVGGTIYTCSASNQCTCNLEDKCTADYSYSKSKNRCYALCSTLSKNFLTEPDCEKYLTLTLTTDCKGICCSEPSPECTGTCDGEKTVKCSFALDDLRKAILEKIKDICRNTCNKLPNSNSERTYCYEMCDQVSLSPPEWSVLNAPNSSGDAILSITLIDTGGQDGLNIKGWCGDVKDFKP